ncbi:hypothetical protein IMCC1989_378 [gamma proteobacterium IMCC1989]|nr:hypothetical protein IMCC1989_378 [gamma proteobacterium IMCC1989]
MSIVVQDVNHATNYVVKVGLTTGVLTQLLCFVVLFFVSHIAISAPKKVLLQEWQASDESSVIVVDHSLWQQVLDQYVVERSQQTYVQYNLLNQVQLKQSNSNTQPSIVDQYLEYLATVNPLTLSRQEQQAYWLNLYNAATVQLIVRNYPVSSITKLGKGLFSFGPWNDDIVTVNQQKISLNDIEHGILRPVYDDPRIHYAVNCASFSCPNLLVTAFTGENIEALLDKGARDYINHTRAVSVKDDELVLSKIYDWFQEDFGGSEEGVISHIKQYANSGLLEQLNTIDTNKIRYAYDWKLNELNELPSQ